MADTIADLAPSEVWNHFYNLTQIPRVSGNEQGVQKYLSDFASSHHLKCRTDRVGNVIIEKPCASPSAPSLILQAHMDMVGVSSADVSFDFATQPINTYIEDGFVKARGTTLGADNGIGVAMILAVLADDSITGLNLKAIFTVQEETSMLGASNLDASELECDYLLNLDSEENGFLYVSCAGSEDCRVSLALEQAPPGEALAGIELGLSGLAGGHSGTDIHKGHANAIITLAKIIRHVSQPVFLGSLNGGTVRNAIANSATATIAVPAGTEKDAIAAMEKGFGDYRSIHLATDPQMQFRTQAAAPAPRYFDGRSSTRALDFITSLPQGALRMSDIDPGVTQSSVNLGVARTEGSTLTLTLMSRSLMTEGLDDVKLRLTSLYDLTEGVSYEFFNRYPCWQSPTDNRLVNTLKEQYRRISGQELKITAMHAGLECAFFVRGNGHLQLASIGPNIFNPHSPREKVEIRGVEEIYRTVLSALQSLS